MRAGKAFIDQLAKLGVKRIYGNPGSTELPILEEIAKSGELTYILALQDGIAVGMAEGEFLKTGVPQLVNLHTINGLGNSIGYIYTAYLNRSPLIITAGQQDTRHIFHEPFLYADLKRIAEPVVKASFEVSRAEDLPKYLIRCWKISITPPYGSVFLSIPSNLAEEEIDYSPITTSFSTSLGVKEEDIEIVSQIINRSENPVIIAGYEIDLYNAHEELRELAEWLNSPVFAEPRVNRAPFYSTHPLFAGTLPPMSNAINSILKDFDLIIIVGSMLMLYPYNPEEIFYGKNVIEISNDPQESSKRIWPTILCDLKLFLRKLKNRVRRKERKYEIRKRKLDINNLTLKVIYNIKNYVNNRTIFDEATSYTTYIRDIIGYNPKKYFIARSYLLGWALPAAIGYSIAGGSSIAIIGDGSLNYAPQALWSASKYNINLKIIVLDNGGYGILRNYAKGLYEYSLKQDWMNPETEADKIANAYGIESKVCNINDDKLEDKLRWLFSDNIPKLLGIKMENKAEELK